MRIVRYTTGEGGATGILDGDDVRAAVGGPNLDQLTPGDVVAALDDVTLLAPVEPRHIICVGRNYHQHADEMGKPIGDIPVLFQKPLSSLIGPGAAIVHPDWSSRVDHEAELAVVIGRPAYKIAADDAFSVIAGYTCANDVTARDLQQGDGFWLRGKGFQTFCPVGPWIETDLDLSTTRVRCRVDDEERQDGPISDLVFDIPTLIAFITRFMRLEPGDLLLTGTPAGVGPMRVGQTVTVEIDGIGALTNPIVAEEAVA